MSSRAKASQKRTPATALTLFPFDSFPKEKNCRPYSTLTKAEDGFFQLSRHRCSDAYERRFASVKSSLLFVSSVFSLLTRVLRQQFSTANIPILTITGYYDDGQHSALGFLKDHYKYNRNANHYLLIGPYHHFGAQGRRKPPVLNGYAIDPVAQMDTAEITFQWMDYVMRGGKRPELLKDKINYQVMGANEWKHAPSLEKMSNETLTLYLTDKKSGDYYQLSKEKP